MSNQAMVPMQTLSSIFSQDSASTLLTCRDSSPSFRILDMRNTLADEQSTKACISFLWNAPARFAPSYLSTTDLHTLTSAYDTEVRKTVLTSCNHAPAELEGQEVEDIPTGSEPALLSATTGGDATIFALFGGQGTNEVYFDELQPLYDIYRPYVAPLITIVTRDALIPLASERTRHPTIASVMGPGQPTMSNLEVPNLEDYGLERHLYGTAPKPEELREVDGNGSLKKNLRNRSTEKKSKSMMRKSTFSQYTFLRIYKEKTSQTLDKTHQPFEDEETFAATLRSIRMHAEKRVENAMVIAEKGGEESEEKLKEKSEESRSSAGHARDAECYRRGGEGNGQEPQEEKTTSTNAATSSDTSQDVARAKTSYPREETPAQSTPGPSPRTVDRIPEILKASRTALERSNNRPKPPENGCGTDAPLSKPLSQATKIRSDEPPDMNRRDRKPLGTAIERSSDQGKPPENDCGTDAPSSRPPRQKTEIRSDESPDVNRRELKPYRTAPQRADNQPKRIKNGRATDTPSSKHKFTISKSPPIFPSSKDHRSDIPSDLESHIRRDFRARRLPGICSQPIQQDSPILETRMAGIDYRDPRSISGEDRGNDPEDLCELVAGAAGHPAGLVFAVAITSSSAFEDYAESTLEALRRLFFPELRSQQVLPAVILELNNRRVSHNSPLAFPIPPPFQTALRHCAHNALDFVTCSSDYRSTWA
ncbi:hypothetical protein BD779DRAFT_1807024 [Infundibulicybe gibba]|nr:hypothetical protein BD779DRAFT_1807024 [Infundibulicybe gibba]